MSTAPEALEGASRTFKVTFIARVLLVTLPMPGWAADLTVTVAGLAGPGSVHVAVCANGFSREDCPFGSRVGARGSTALLTIRNIPPGTYGIAAFQDTNGDGQLNRTPAGLPLEPYGFSNGVGRTAPPRFARAAFPLTDSRTIGIVLNPPPRQ